MNPYQVLGVEQDASKEDIKAAYRKLAMEHHPDRNQDSPESLEKFREVQEAYDTLTKPQQNNQQQGYHQQRNPFEDGHFAWSFGQGGRWWHGGQPPQPKNHDLQALARITLEQAYEGTELSVSINNKIITISVPRGVQHGQRLRVEGEGGRDLPDLPAGDLYVIIEIVPHQVFQYGGANLQTNVDIDVLDLITGCDIEVTTISGEKAKVNVPKGTQVNTKLRVKGKGMPYLDRYGDLFLTISPDVPHLTDEQLEKIRELRAK